MEELATVTSISKGKVTVVSQVKSTCNSCKQVDTCASGQVAKAIPHKNLSFTLPLPDFLDEKSINEGDCVVIAVPEGEVLQSAWQVYLLPLLGLFLFSALAQWLVQEGLITHELIALVIGLVGGYFGYLFAKHLQNDPQKRNRLQPKILKALPKPMDVNNLSGFN